MFLTMQAAPARWLASRTARLQRVMAVGAVVALVLAMLFSMPVDAQTSTPSQTQTSTPTATPTTTPTRTPTPTATPFPCPRDSRGMVGTYADIHRWNSIVVQVSSETGVPANVIKAIMWVESGGQLNARSPLTSSGYYFGLMQVGATSSLPAQMKDVMWLCDNPYRQTLAGATEMINKSIAIGTRQWDLVAGAYFGYGVDVNGTSTSSYMNMFRGHVIALVGTTPGGTDWIMPPTPTPGPTNTAVVTNFTVGQQIQVGADRINFRATAGMNGAKIGVLEPGTLATILAGPVRSDNYDWYQIRTTANVTGWAAGQFFVLPGGSSQTPVGSPTSSPTRTPTSTPGPIGGFRQGDAIAVNVARLNLRTGSSLGSTVVTVLEQGDLGSVSGTPIVSGTTIWLPVTMNGDGPGWVAAQYVVKTTAVSTATRTTTATRVASAVPSSTATVSTASQFQQGDAVSVTAGRLNLRTAASGTSNVVVVLLRGDRGSVTGPPVRSGTYLWVPTSFPGKGNGWVASQFIVEAPGSSATPTPTRTPSPVASGTAGASQSQASYRVTVPRLNLRASPSMTGTILLELTQNQAVLHLGQMQVVNSIIWYRVQSGSQTGWVASQYIALAQVGATGTPTRTATPDPSVLGAGESFRVTAGLLNMRTGAGTTSSIIRSIPQGTTGSILAGPQDATGYTWYRISTLYGEGWVVGDYLERTSVLAAGLGEAPGLTASLTPEPATSTRVASETRAPESPTETVADPITTPDTVTPESPAPTATGIPLPPTETATATATATSTPSATATIAPPDSDADGVPDSIDACPGISDTGQDADGDGTDDACDPTPLGDPTEPPLVEYQVSVSAAADTSVSAVSPDAPQPGEQTGGLSVGGPGGDIAYMTFWVEGAGSGQITSATLYLPAATGSGAVTVSIIPGGVIDEWSLTYASAPAGSYVTELWVDAGAEVPVDLTGWIAGDGPVTIIVSGNADPAIVLGSKDGGWPARIDITAAS